VLITKYEGTEVLTNSFNHIKNKKIVPAEWKTTIICPIYKVKGFTGEQGNYRGI
jgi:hypothetical protein